MELSRRQFVQAAAGAAVIPSLGAGTAPKLPTRTLGKTGEQLSIIGFGGIVVMDETTGEASNIVAEAVDRGIN